MGEHVESDSGGDEYGAVMIGIFLLPAPGVNGEAILVWSSVESVQPFPIWLSKILIQKLLEGVLQTTYQVLYIRALLYGWIYELLQNVRSPLVFLWKSHKSQVTDVVRSTYFFSPTIQWVLSCPNSNYPMFDEVLEKNYNQYKIHYQMYFYSLPLWFIDVLKFNNLFYKLVKFRLVWLTHYISRQRN